VEVAAYSSFAVGAYHKAPAQEQAGVAVAVVLIEAVQGYWAEVQSRELQVDQVEESTSAEHCHMDCWEELHLGKGPVVEKAESSTYWDSAAVVALGGCQEFQKVVVEFQGGLDPQQGPEARQELRVVLVRREAKEDVGHAIRKKIMNILVELFELAPGGHQEAETEV
jgi:hypothetical protein